MDWGYVSNRKELGMCPGGNLRMSVKDPGPINPSRANEEKDLTEILSHGLTSLKVDVCVDRVELSPKVDGKTVVFELARDECNGTATCQMRKVDWLESRRQPQVPTI
jgi:hypothetical protein